MDTECKLRQEKTATVRLCCHRHTQMSQNVTQSANSDMCNRFVFHHLHSGLKKERKKCRAFKNKSEGNTWLLRKLSYFKKRKYVSPPERYSNFSLQHTQANGNL